jgi:hypothetical protein
MKNFLQYLSETQKTYEFRIKIANYDPKDKLDKLKVGLEQYAVESVGTPKRLPIKSNDIDFPSIPNCEIFLMDAVLKYPVNDTQLRSIVAEHLGCPASNIVVVSPNHPEEQRRWGLEGNDIKEFKQGESVLDKPYEDSPEGKKAGIAYANKETILKELNKKPKFEIAGSESAEDKTLNDVPTGTQSPMGSTKNKLPAVKGR